MAKSVDAMTVQDSDSGTVGAKANGINNPRLALSDNSGTTGVKYQLRPRSLKQRRGSDSDWHFQERVKHRSRQQPLSRYRRKTANARERYRMRQINTAFETLRGALPSWACSRPQSSDLTKISTLKLASAYIQSLQDVLEGKANLDPTASSSASYSWRISSHFEENQLTPQECLSPPQPTSASKYQISQNHTKTEAELVTFLCGSSDSGLVQANLESFSYLSPVSREDPVTLFMFECDQVHSWSEGQQVPIVT